ncbi:uncharacterized protein LY89DRAFT_504150 [Mollisia scopiformis]|uniref:Rhodopsin domain-containing protein n=1 Tax=Mollisia scopiformis TaxID=149040 RepID=A0A194XF19_MOLSC|nr:uncharacterized protein LY89DRAFT_504150 [Mollisia scopiformis]KUJ18746.1 hypothetical protein LY89DRAFT_504150 [Mollisia scopiformis]
MTTSPLQEFALFIVVFFPLLALVVVCLRTYSRISTGQFGWDDGLIIVAMAMAIGESYVTWMYIKTNFVGIHIYDIPADVDPVPGLKYNYAVQVLYNPVLAIVKNSILMFLLRLTGTRKAVRYTILGLIAVNTALMIAIFITVIFQCLPIAYNWDTTIKGGHCVAQGAFYVATTTLTLFTDILVLALPFWIVMGLKMERKTKIAVIGIFFLGFIVTVIGVIRMVLIIQVFFLPAGPDPTYTIGFCTSAIEINVAIMTASAAAMKPLFKRWFPRFFSALSNSGPYSDGPYAGGTGRYTRNGTNGTKHKSVLKGGHGGFELKGMRGERGLTEIQSQNRDGSEEEIMTFDGIVKTTNVSVKYAERDVDSVRAGQHSRKTSDYGMRTSVESL